MGVVTEGIIAMPYELAMADELTRMQFYQTVTSEIATLRARLETVEAETRERAAARVESFSLNEHISFDMREGIFPEQSDIQVALADAIRNLEPRHD